MSRPFMLFVGVSTAASAVNHLFGQWASRLGVTLGLEGRDLPLNAPPDRYRELVTEFRASSDVLRGALITSHKAALFDAASELFDIVTPVAARLGEIGMIYWRDRALVADANDSFSTVRVLRHLLDSAGPWSHGAREAVVLGGGGAGLALANALATVDEFRCSGVTIAEVRSERAQTVGRRIESWRASIPMRLVLTSGVSDDIVGAAGEGSLIANATGLGKDRPGSPVSSLVKFPMRGIVWEFNYRFGVQEEPHFLEIAGRQSSTRQLRIEDGWDYFVWGWLTVMSQVVAVDPSPYYSGFCDVAESQRPAVHRRML